MEVLVDVRVISGRELELCAVATNDGVLGERGGLREWRSV